ncbi:MAG: SdrD B-like domain-containing protein [Clostridiaceae bacterium]
MRVTRKKRAERKKRKLKLKYTTRLILFLFAINMFNFIPYISYADDDSVTMKIEKSVDNTEVYTGENFTYTIKYSNPSTTADAYNVVITDELPSNIEYISAVKSSDVKEINVTGNLIEFKFKETLKAGSSGVLKIIAKFPEGISSGGEANKALNTAVVSLDNGPTITSNEVTVTPKILTKQDYSVKKSKLTPTATPALGQPVTYEIKVTGNSKLGGVDLHDIAVTDTLPSGANYVSSTNDGKPIKASGEETNDTVTWTIDELKVGQSVSRYVTLTYSSDLFTTDSSDLTKTSSVTNNVSVKGKILGSDEYLDPVTASTTHEFDVATANVNGDFSKTGRQSNDRYSKGQTAVFHIGNIENTGNIPLDKIEIVDPIPSELNLTQISTGKFSSNSTIKVYYKTNINSEYTQWGDTYVGTSKTTLIVSSLGIGSNYVTEVKWEITNGDSGLPAGFKNIEPIDVNAVVTVDPETSITNIATMTATKDTINIEKSSSKIIYVIDEKPWIVPTKWSTEVDATEKTTNFYMNDYVEYHLKIENNALATGDYINPIAIDVLPNELEDIRNVEFDSTNSSITNWTSYDDSGSVNISGTSHKTLKWDFTGELKPGEYIEITYEAKIKELTKNDTFNNDLYITSNDNLTFENDDELINDVNDLDGDSLISDRLAKTNQEVFVIFQGSVDSTKWVKGELDDTWGHYGIDDGAYEGYGSTLPGGISDYRLVVKNSESNGPITNIVVIDVLPFAGDTGVLDIDARESEWRPYLVNEITGENGGELPTGAKVYYSTNADVSKEELYDPENKHGQDSDLWTETPPTDITTVRALKFEFGDLALDSDEQVVLEWPMRAPLGAPTGEIAWNSFGYGATYTDYVNGVKVQESFLPSEPLKVGYKIEADPSETFALGDYVWEDMNKDGIQNDGETGINGILVKLYESDGTTLAGYTRTGDDQDGNPGYYAFPDVSPGDYYVEFIFSDEWEITSFDVGDGTTDSNIDSLNREAYVDDGTDFIDDSLTYSKVRTSKITVNSNDLSIDAGLYKVASLGNYVWNDDDADGIQDSGEMGINGVEVNLLDDSDTVVKTTITADKDGKAGYYIFEDLEPGDYKVQFVNPSDHYKFSDNANGSDLGKDSDGVTISGSSITTDTINLESGEDDLTVDQGMYLGKIGDYVWHDKNADGIQDSGEGGISGAKVNLIKDSSVISTTTTNDSGYYIFKDLIPGDYTVEFELPSGYHKASPKDSTGSTDSNDSDIDTATYKTGIINIEAGERDLTNDAGFYKYASIGDFVWEDLDGDGKQETGESGVNGIKVDLIQNGLIIATKTTVDKDGDVSKPGYYLFENLEPGDYKVKFTLPDSEYIFSPKDKTTNTIDSDVDTSNGETIYTTLQSDETDLKWDAGIHKAAIGDFVWEDVNANGVQDSGESGISGVTIDLLDGSGNAVKDVDGNAITTTTNSNGFYAFYRLDAGDYNLKFTLPIDALFSMKDQGSGDDQDKKDSDVDTATGETISTYLDAGEVDFTWDAGIYYPASIGNYVWHDTNGSGVQDSGESGINGVTVKLLDKDGITLNTITTADKAGVPGYYIFEDLVPGDYSLEFIKPLGYDGFTLKDQGSNDGLDSDVDITSGKTVTTTLVSNEDDMTFDAGLVNYVVLGDYVWHDSNMDGIQDGLEAGIKDLTVNLYKKVNGIYVWVAKDTTDSDGEYLFDTSYKLIPGDYQIRFTKPDGFTYTKENNTDDAEDSDVASSGYVNITLASGDDIRTIDAGVYELAKLGNYIWNDVNVDGIQDTDESAITESVQIKLYKSDGTYVKSDTTTNGIYSIIDIEPGAYYLEAVSPNGYIVTSLDSGLKDDVDSDFYYDKTSKTYKTTTFNLSEGEEDLTFDLGMYKGNSLGDFVWKDKNADGMQDDGEVGIEGVTVNLLDENGDSVKDKDENDIKTETDASGKYEFTNFPKGTYIVEFIAPTDYLVSDYGQGSDGDKDSDAVLMGRTDVISLDVAEDKTDVDAGLYKKASLGDKVWYDKNGNGKQDAGEAAIEGVTVNLIRDGSVILTTTTNGSGIYGFTDLMPGEYTVEFQATKTLFKLTDANKSGISDGEDSDADKTTNKTQVITLNSGDNNLTVDAGYTVKTGITLEKSVYVGFVGGKVSGNELVQGLNGTEITYLFKITNTGDTYLKNIALVDANLGLNIKNIDLDLEGLILVSGNKILAPGELAVYAYKSSINEDLLNTATVTGTSTDDENKDYLYLDKVQDTDTAEVDAVHPDIDIQKTIYEGDYEAGKDGNESAKGMNKDMVTYIFTVTNTGDTYLNNIKIDDDVLGISIDDMTYIDGNLILASGESVKYYYESTIIDKDLENHVTVTGTPTDKDGIDIPNTKDVNDEDTAISYALASVGDYVWYDNDGDGVQDTGEKGINGVTIKLLDKDGKPVLDSDSHEIKVVTGDNGEYIFDRLEPGEYTVVVDISTLPEGLKQTYELDDNFDGSYEITLKPADEINTVDFGYYKLGKLGDYVWNDVNGNGVQEVEEAPIDGVFVNLYKDGEMAPFKTTTTDAAGYYIFDDLELGDYYVEFVKPEGYEITRHLIGDNALNSDADTDGKTQVVKVIAGYENMTLDAGFYLPASIGDYLWYDNNGDGVQDNDELPLAGVTLNLLDKDGKVVGTATTDKNGKYIFDTLLPGKYTIVVDKTTLQEGLKQTYELDGSIGGSVVVNLTQGQIVDNVDFGYYKLGKLGNYVWEDSNADGIQNSGETGASTVTVKLYQTDGTLLDTTTTDENGLYEFKDLVLGEYYIQFVAPVGYEISKTNGSDSKSLDSDANSDGKTNIIKVVAGTDDKTWDAGLYKLASIGDYVWKDTNLNGLQDAEEKGLKEVVVNLYDGLGNLVKTTKTDENGKYEFINLVPGQYQVEFITPEKYKITLQKQGSDLSKDSNVDKLTGRSGNLFVKSGENNETIDVGLYKVTSISGNVEHGETGDPIDGATVTVIDKDKEVIDETITDKNGNYEINEIPSGNEYTIKIEKDGYIDEAFSIDIPDEDIPLGMAIFPAKILPKTGLPYYNIILVGAIAAIIIGSILVLGFKKEKVK